MTEFVDEDFYKPEDFCDICAESRKREELPPNLLVLLPTVTARQGFHIYACPDCDGGVIDLAMR